MACHLVIFMLSAVIIIIKRCHIIDVKSCGLSFGHIYAKRCHFLEARMKQVKTFYLLFIFISVFMDA